jgi:urease gamma subunit
MNIPKFSLIHRNSYENIKKAKLVKLTHAEACHLITEIVINNKGNQKKINRMCAIVRDVYFKNKLIEI